ncbi:hypothetical protein J8J27_29710, partial [Mycobacterium tuberculosis]|nr:hypothetical protein [Mycobacterium tuberculosis]
ELAGQTFVAHVPDGRAFAPRAGLRYHVAAGDVHLFDAESGRRLAERRGEGDGEALERPVMLADA